MPLFFGVLTPLVPQSQPTEKSSSSWIRVQSDDGKFSIEVPAEHKYFEDKDGFVVGRDSYHFELKNMRLLTGYVDRSVLSFEIYDAGRAALATLIDMDESTPGKVEKSELKLGDLRVRRFVQRSAEYYFVRQYFASDGQVYVLTAISREKETPAVAKFLNSVRFASENEKLDAKDSILISQLKFTGVVIDQQLSPTSPKPPTQAKSIEPGLFPTIILSAPRASFTPVARNHGVQGAIRAKVVLSADGSVPKIVIVGKALPAGLLRNVIFSAIRLKFLPSERNGVPRSVIKTFEYVFSIY
ncbi:MAG: hypothetical protein IPM25_08480 [Chloracidobacterium sp.]|nr:hypothetical protein [Chloracidobacterium sp.]